jgi:hypothetical protein
VSYTPLRRVASCRVFQMQGLVTTINCEHLVVTRPPPGRARQRHFVVRCRRRTTYVKVLTKFLVLRTVRVRPKDGVRRVESTGRSSSSGVFVPSTVRRTFVNEVDRQLVSGAECDRQVVSCRKTSRTVVVAVLVTRWEPCRLVDVVGKTPSSPTSSYCGRGSVACSEFRDV